MTPEEEQLADTIYTAYCQSIGGGNWVSEAPNPAFNTVPLAVKQAWLAAAQAAQSA